MATIEAPNQRQSTTAKKSKAKDDPEKLRKWRNEAMPKKRRAHEPRPKQHFRVIPFPRRKRKKEADDEDA